MTITANRKKRREKNVSAREAQWLVISSQWRAHSDNYFRWSWLYLTFVPMVTTAPKSSSADDDDDVCVCPQCEFMQWHSVCFCLFKRSLFRASATASFFLKFFPVSCWCMGCSEVQLHGSNSPFSCLHYVHERIRVACESHAHVYNFWEYYCRADYYVFGNRKRSTCDIAEIVIFNALSWVPRNDLGSIYYSQYPVLITYWFSTQKNRWIVTFPNRSARCYCGRASPMDSTLAICTDTEACARFD